MGPLPVLSEGEEKVLVERTTDSSRKEFLQRKMVDPLSVKEFPTVNQGKHLLKITCLRMDGFEHSIAIILSCPLALVKVCVTSSNVTLGETDIRKL
jgi:hypothetical protein